MKKKESINNHKVTTNSGNGNEKIKYKTLTINGTKYRTQHTRKYIHRTKWEKPNIKHIHAYIPGTVDKICVHEGDTVKKEDNLLILEAMKMKNTIFSPLDGTIKHIYIKSGDTVHKGFLMMEFE